MFSLHFKGVCIGCVRKHINTDISALKGKSNTLISARGYSGRIDVTFRNTQMIIISIFEDIVSI